jgi:hypothetical protein
MMNVFRLSKEAQRLNFALRINDIEIRRAFLSRQYWNAILFDMAKEHNLISKEAKVPTRDTMRGIPVFHSM